MPPLKAIVWDADGVLIKRKHLFTELLKRDFGLDTKKMMPFFHGAFRECAIGKADLKKELEKVLPEWGWTGSVDELLSFWFTKGTELDEETLAFATKLHDSGIQTFLATDNEKYRGACLRKMLIGVCDKVFLSTEFGCRKNETAFWKKVYDELAEEANGNPIKRDEILYIDDDSDDIAVAKEFGLSTFTYNGDLDSLKKNIEQDSL